MGTLVTGSPQGMNLRRDPEHLDLKQQRFRAVVLELPLSRERRRLRLPLAAAEAPPRRSSSVTR